MRKCCFLLTGFYLGWTDDRAFHMTWNHFSFNLSELYMQSTVRWSRVCVNISSTAELVPCDGWNGQTSLTSVQLKPTEQREALLAYTLHLHLHHTAEEESSLEHLSRTRTSTPHTSNHHTNDPQDRALSPDLTQTRQQVTRIWFQVKQRPYNDVCFEDYLGCFALFCTSPKSRCCNVEKQLREKKRDLIAPVIFMI